MRIVLNSDILHTDRPAAAGLPNHLDRFCRDARDAGAILVLPRTTLLENQRHQERLVEQSIARVEAAMELLGSYGVQVPAVNVRDLVGSDDVLTTLSATGVNVETVDPTLTEYRAAEERACLRLAPHPPEAKSDEMRDLVIWEVALGIARRDGAAILLSRDNLHSDDRGAEESRAAGLLRAKTVEEALDLLGSASPAAVRAREILSIVWSSLCSAGLPLEETMTVQRVSNVEFVADAEGRLSSTLHFSAPSDGGEFEAVLGVAQRDPHTIEVELREMQLDGRPWGPGTTILSADGELPRADGSGQEELEELRRLIGS